MARAFGTLAAGLMAAAGLVNGQAPPCNSPDPNYDMMVSFPSPMMNMMYRVDTANNVLKVKATLLSGNGWLGVGFSPDGGMVGGNAIIGQTGPMPSAYEFALMGMRPNTVVPSNAAGARAMAVSTATGLTELTFEYPFGTGPVPIWPNVPTNVILATGGNNPALSRHTERSTQPFTFVQCARPQMPAAPPADTAVAPPPTQQNPQTTVEQPKTETETEQHGEEEKEDNDDDDEHHEVAVAGCDKSTDAEYDTMLEVANPPVTLFYKVENGESVKIKAVSATDGWLAVGFSPNGEMEGSTAVIGETAGNMDAAEYEINGMSRNSIIPANDAAVTDASVTVENGKTVLGFTIPFGVGKVPVTSNGDNKLILASGGNVGALGFHRNAKSGLTINFSRCLPATDAPATTTVIATSTLTTVVAPTQAPSLVAPTQAPSPPAKPDTVFEDTKSTNMGVTSSGANGCASTDPAYDGMITVAEPALKLFYKNNDGKSIQLKAVSASSGWLGVGFSTNGDMIGSTAVIGQTAGNPAAGMYDLNGMDDGSVVPSNDVGVTDMAVTVENGQTVLSFTMQYGVGKVPLQANGINTLLFASGGESRALGYHETRTAMQIDFSSCAVASSSAGGSKRAMFIAHAALMFVGWAILIPIGVGSSVYRAGLSKDALWFKLHRAIQSIGLVLATVGFIIAVVLVKSAHFNRTHTIIGLVVMILGWLQPLNAFIRPHPAPTGENKPAKRLVWEIVHKNGGRLALLLAAVTIAFGIDTAKNVSQIDDKTANVLMLAFGAFAGVVGIVLIAPAVYSTLTCCRRKPVGEGDESSQDGDGGRSSLDSTNGTTVWALKPTDAGPYPNEQKVAPTEEKVAPQ